MQLVRQAIGKSQRLHLDVVERKSTKEVTTWLES